MLNVPTSEVIKKNYKPLDSILQLQTQCCDWKSIFCLSVKPK